jgi:hypothetical protein
MIRSDSFASLASGVVLKWIPVSTGEALKTAFTRFID